MKNKMVKIYVVMGMAGEYEDRMDWAIMAFLEERKAREYVKKATKKAKEWINIVGSMIDVFKPRKEPPKNWNKYDPDFYKYWKGENFGYYYFEVPISKNTEGVIK